MPPFQYKARPAEAWDKRASGKLYEGFALDQYQTLNLKDDNAIRILPPTWEDPQHFGIDLWVHYSVGPMNATVICLHRMKGEKCPQCEAWARAEEQGRPDANQLKPTRRVLVWCIDRNEDKGFPYLWAMPQTVDTSIASICKDRMTGELFQIDHPDTGYDVYFQRKQKGGGAMFVEYVGFQLARRPTQVEAKYIDYILQHPLPHVLNWRSYEEIERLNLGGGIVEEKPNQPTATSQLSAPAPVATAPAPPAAFVSEWVIVNGVYQHCSECGEPQQTSPSGITCKNGHGGVQSLEELQAAPPPPPPPPQPVAVMPTPPSNGQATPPSPAPIPTTSRTAQLLKERFNTGVKK